MAAPLKLETFDPAAPPAESATGMSDAIEEIRLNAYEKGYSAGWEDAVASQADDQHRIREDLAANLRNLSFTWWEARAHLLRGLEPLLLAMTGRVLPELARATLGAAVVVEVQAEAGHLGAAPAVIEVAPADRVAVASALGPEPALGVRLLENPALAPGQVHFRFGEEERVLDHEALLAAIGALVADFLRASHSPSDERQIRHG